MIISPEILEMQFSILQLGFYIVCLFLETCYIKGCSDGASVSLFQCHQLRWVKCTKEEVKNKLMFLDTRKGAGIDKPLQYSINVVL